MSVDRWCREGTEVQDGTPRLETHTHAAWVENYEDLEMVEPRAPKAS